MPFRFEDFKPHSDRDKIEALATVLLDLFMVECQTLALRMTPELAEFTRANLREILLAVSESLRSGGPDPRMSPTYRDGQQDATEAEISSIKKALGIDLSEEGAA